MYAVLYAEGRRGQARCVFRGKIPEDLKLLVSEQYQDPSPENATWQYVRPRVAVLRPRDQKSTGTARGASLASAQKAPGLTQVYLKFVSANPCKFSCEVTFPEEEDQLRRKRAQEIMPGYSGNTEEQKVPFKQKIAKEVDEMVRDEGRAKSFLGVVRSVKELKQNRGHSGSNKEVDFIQRNVEKAEQAHPRIKETNLITKIETQRNRAENAKLKRKIIEIETNKFKVLQLQKWDLLRAKRQEFSEIVAEERRQQKFKRDWTRMANTRRMLGEIYDLFMERRHQVLLHRHRVKMATRIQKAYRRWYARRVENASDPNARHRLKIHNAMTVFTVHIHDHTQASA